MRMGSWKIELYYILMEGKQGGKGKTDWILCATVCGRKNSFLLITAEKWGSFGKHGSLYICKVNMLNKYIFIYYIITCKRK